ncbi:hypothetical protein F5Y02DRAFT_354096 [Annulohypoxylon stygium]|nr:hypothetical protein F5Y02DRAFT_354096 [Annulohypoxylon stygium]
MELPWTLPTWCNALISLYLLVTLNRSFIWTRVILRSKPQRRSRLPEYIVVALVWITLYMALFVTTPFYIIYYGTWQKPSGLIKKAIRPRHQPLYEALDIEKGLQDEDTGCGRWNGVNLSTMRKRIFTRDTHRDQVFGDIRLTESRSWFVWKKTGSFQTSISKNEWA